MSASVRLVVAAASALFLELVLIRWIGGEAPVLAYFKNFPLLAAFLGMGAGACLARARDLSWLAPLGIGALGLVLATHEPLGLGLDLIDVRDPSLDVWGAVSRERGSGRLPAALLVLSLMAAGFVGLGQVVGRLLDDAGSRLPAYGLDLAGGLVGVVVAVVSNLLGAPPALLVPLGLGAFALAVPGRARIVAVVFGLIVPAAHLAARPTHDVIWSPYYRIDLFPHMVRGVPLGERLLVNRDLHQLLLDFAHDHPAAVRRTIPYGVPYEATGVDPRGAKVLIAGAGSGNDAAAALARGVAHVTAIELDPAIAGLGRTRHPQRPYADGRVMLIQDDARAAFRGLAGADFDLLVYGILDAHASLAAFGSLRHDDYVYTVEGLRSGVATLGTRGVACLSFMEGDRRWLGDRLAATVERATGRLPIATRAPGEGRVHLLFGPGLDLETTRTRVTDDAPLRLSRAVAPTTDDWPFLYANPASPPLIYLSALGALVLATVLVVLVASHAPTVTSPRRVEMILLGAAFLLVETRAITDVARLFGATWLVTGLVLVAVFALLIVANALASRVPSRAAPVFGVLAALALVLARPSLPALEALPPLGRGIATVVVVGLPLGLGGVAFSRAFARVPHGAAGVALGANLAGAALGGGLEALSLVLGLSAVTWIAASLYVTWSFVHAVAVRDVPR